MTIRKAQQRADYKAERSKAALGQVRERQQRRRLENLRTQLVEAGILKPADENPSSSPHPTR